MGDTDDDRGKKRKKWHLVGQIQKDWLKTLALERDLEGQVDFSRKRGVNKACFRKAWEYSGNRRWFPLARAQGTYKKAIGARVRAVFGPGWQGCEHPQQHWAGWRSRKAKVKGAGCLPCCPTSISPLVPRIGSSALSGWRDFPGLLSVQLDFTERATMAFYLEPEIRLWDVILHRWGREWIVTYLWKGYLEDVAILSSSDRLSQLTAQAFGQKAYLQLPTFELFKWTHK